jgi:hypothetical protein
MTDSQTCPESRSFWDFLALAEPVVFDDGPAASTVPTARLPPTNGQHAEPPVTTPTASQAQTHGEQEVVDAIQIDVLGKVAYGKVRVFSRYHRQVETISGVSHMRYEDLLEIAGPPARDRVSEAIGDDMPPGVFSMRDVRRAISMLAGYHKISDETELGPGCWGGLAETGDEHPSVVIVGNREAAYWNGDQILQRIDRPRCRGRLLDFETACSPWFDFKQLAEYMQAAKEKSFRERAMNECINMFSRWRWKTEASCPIVLTGMVFATWVQTLWEWRPQVSVIGRTSSGKSMFLKALGGLFGGLCETCSDSTEAGIRQIIENSARVILFDEFDVEDRRQAEEQQKILKMLRASGRGDAIFRGTASQKGKKFTLRHIVWMAGIQISSQREADRNRYVNVELMPPREDMRGKLMLPGAGDLNDLGQRILATAIYCIHQAKRVAVEIKDTRIQGVHDRIVESYAVPAAILAAVQGESADAARSILSEMLAEIASEDHGGQSDEQTLMADILGAQVQIGPSRYSVAQLLDVVINRKHGWSDSETALESRGLRIDEYTDHAPAAFRGKPCFLIAYQLVTEYLVKQTKWGTQAIEQILRRLPSAVQSRRRVGGQRVQTVAISLDLLKSEFLGTGDTQNLDGEF